MSFFTTSSGLYFSDRVSLKTRPRKGQTSMSIASTSDVTPDFTEKVRYRSALHIPDHIREHCHIYLDEQLYTSALTLLSDLIISGAAHPERDNRGVIAPIPLHIELVSCLLVHPRYTSQAPPDERAELSSRSIIYLRNLLAILGPVNARLDEAFSLTSETTRRIARRNRNTADAEGGTSASDTDDSFEGMKGIIANKGRLRTCAKDFWHIVGWVFNCSVKYPKRWKYWKVWLTYMLEVLDADWNERDALDSEDPVFQARLQKDPHAVCESKLLRKSLLCQYMSEVEGRSSALKRVLRAVFADGSPESLKEFPEIFANETREVRHTGQKRKRGDKFGDYGDEEEAEYDSSDQQGQEDSGSSGCSTSNQDPWVGGTESLILRQRIVTLLSRVSHFLPDESASAFDLYEAFYHSVKPLPLPAFSFFLSPTDYSSLFIEVYVSLCQLLLLRLLPGNAPAPATVINKVEDEISQIVLEKCFLPFAASTSSLQDNAKASILMENMLRLLLMQGCQCEYSSRFAAALEKGILARENKVKGDKKRKDGDMVWLTASGQRLRLLLALVKKNTPKK